MHTTIVRTGLFGPTLRLSPLRNGDTATVAALFERLGDASRRTRFLGAKPRLTASELEQLAAEDCRRHAVVAYVDGDPRPAGIARFVRDGDSAEIAFAVADSHQGERIGTTLATALLRDARAAGIASITATVDSSNRAAISLLRRVTRNMSVRHEGTALEIRAQIA